MSRKAPNLPKMMFMNSILKYDAIKPLFLTVNGIKMQLNLSQAENKNFEKTLKKNIGNFLPMHRTS